MEKAKPKLKEANERMDKAQSFSSITSAPIKSNVLLITSASFYTMLEPQKIANEFIKNINLVLNSIGHLLYKVF